MDAFKIVGIFFVQALFNSIYAELFTQATWHCNYVNDCNWTSGSVLSLAPWLYNLNRQLT